MMPPKCTEDGGSAAQKRASAPLADTVRAKKKSSTPSHLTGVLIRVKLLLYS